MATVFPSKELLTLWDEELASRRLPKLTGAECKMLVRTLKQAFDLRGYDLTKTHLLILTYFGGEQGETLGFSVEGFIKSLRTLFVKLDGAQRRVEQSKRENERVKKIVAPVEDATSPEEAKKRLAEMRRKVMKNA